MAHAPDPSPLFVTLRMIAWDFVVRDDFVVPIDEVEALIRAGAKGNRTKPFVVGKHKVWQLLITEAWAIGRHAHGLDLPRDRVGNVKDVAISLRPIRGVGEGQPAQA